MKLAAMPLFIIFFFGLYFLASFYVYLRGLQALPSNFWLKVLYTLIFIFLSSAYFFSRKLEHTDFYVAHEICYWAGAVWMAALLYFFISVLLIDIVRLLNLAFHFLPLRGTEAYHHLKNYTSLGTVAVVFLLLVFGYWNASYPRERTLEIKINKQAGQYDTINAVVVSDIHLGSLFGRHKVKELTDKINKFSPDIVFLVGDILDEAQLPIFRKNIGAPLKDIDAPLGIYAVTGNHEYIGGVESAARYLTSLGITLVRDTSVLVNSSIYIAGREDRDITRFISKTRKPLKEVVRGIDTKLPLILLDHQPYHLDQAVENGVDLQLSGHTHNGQFWPFTIIIKKIYEVNQGYKRKDKTHVYVSSGYGTWGPPFRIGSVPEIVNIKINFGAKP